MSPSGRATALTPFGALSDRHRHDPAIAQTAADGDAESATTSRNAASAACRAARRVSGSGATIAI